MGKKSGLILSVDESEDQLVDENFDHVITNLSNLTNYVADLPTHVEYLQQFDLFSSKFKIICRSDCFVSS